jgi:hypothetical protein
VRDQVEYPTPVAGDDRFVDGVRVAFLQDSAVYGNRIDPSLMDLRRGIGCRGNVDCGAERRASSDAATTGA